MTIKVRLRRVNPDFSQEYADFHNNGKECMQNPKFDIVYEIRTKNIERIELIPVWDYPIIAEDSDGLEKTFILRNMCALNCFEKETGALYIIAVSRTALAKAPEKRPMRNFTNHKNESITQYFDIKADAELVELRPGFYVAQDELPNELK